MTAPLAADPARPAQRSRPLPAWAPLAAIVVLAAALRFGTIAAQSIWFDEAATWQLTRLPFGEMLSVLPDRESNPPLFYVLEWLAVRALGDGEAGLRAVSALAGTATVALAAGVGQWIGGRRAGLATAALVACNPLLVWFSQEARSYALVALLTTAALLLCLRALDDGRPRTLAGWALAAALAIASHYFAIFVLAPQAAWLLWRHPRRRAAIAAVGAVAVAFLALLPMLLEQRGNPYDIAADGLAVRAAQIPKQFLLGYRGPLPALSLAVAIAVVATGAWLALRGRDRPRQRRLGLVAGVGAVGVVAPLAAALVGADYVNARNLIPAVVPLAAALAAALAGAADPGGTGRRLGAAGLAAFLAVSALALGAVALDRAYQRADWRGLADALGRSADARAIVVSPANGEAALRYYRRALRPMPESGAPVREVDVVGVAVASGPGDEPTLPPLVGTVLPVPGFEGPRREAADTYEILRFRRAEPHPMPPVTLAQVRFGELPPSSQLLPAGR